MTGGSDACYTTSDGGESWELCLTGKNGTTAGGVSFDRRTDKLYVDLFSDAVHRTLFSTDFGISWNVLVDSTAEDFDFSDRCTIASSVIDTGSGWEYGFLTKEDSSRRWLFTTLPNKPIQVCWAEPLIVGESVFAATACRVTIWRSDDCGVNWQMLNDFGQMYDTTTFKRLSPYGTGFIKGTIDHLSVQTDSGMYLSTDGGYDWKFDGGPGYTAPPSGDAPFWSDKGYTYAARVYHNDADVVLPDGLWMQKWGTASVNEQGLTNAELRIGSVAPTLGTKELRVTVVRGGDQEYELQIFDVLGKLQLTRSESTATVRLDVSQLADGHYFLRASAGSVVDTRRFTKGD
jgi:hypothetical protein